MKVVKILWYSELMDDGIQMRDSTEQEVLFRGIDS
jgi:hypothetical protein